MPVTDPLSTIAQPRLRINCLQFAYPATPGRELFNALSATLTPGVTLVQGGDGSGKTTLLKLLAGALQPTAGGVDWHAIIATPGHRAPQVFWADPRLDVHDALPVADYLAVQRQQFIGFDEALLADLLVGCRLEAHLHKPLFMLSTGSRRKVLLAAALASGAALTLMDEPFAALDAPSIRCLTDALRLTASDTARICVIADYVKPVGVPLAAVIDLDG